MAKHGIKVDVEKCSGCLRCELGCSDAHTKSFNPSKSRIQVTMNERDRYIRFTNDCVWCGICVDHCFYGALTRSKQEEANQ